MTAGEMAPAERIIIALDGMSGTEASRLARLLAGKIRFLKVGLQLFVSEGPGVVRDIREAGFEVFLDLKLHDIPHQVALACRSATRLGVSMITVHTLGGRQMLSEAVEATREEAGLQGSVPPKLVGVTVLTSLDRGNLAELGLASTVEEEVLRLARLALDCGLDGVVASPRETGLLRAELGKEFIVVTPGIRATPMFDDQKRTMSPREAISAGSSFLVIGRPVTRSGDPVAAIEAIAAELL